MEDKVYTAHLLQSFERYLEQLKGEVKGYSDDRQLWIVQGAIANSAGNLVVHLLGNLHHYIGARLGQTGYVRNRPLEFSLNFKPRAELLEELEACRMMLREVLLSEDRAALRSVLPEITGDEKTEEMSLVHLLGHLAYHVGQINYHRRLTDTANYL